MEMIVDNSSLDSTNLLEDFKIRVEEAMGLVARMNAEDTIEAVHYWNSFSERLQQLVYHTAEAAEIEAIEAMALDLEQDSERSSNVASDSAVLPNGINITTNADPSSIDQDSQSSTVTEKKFFDIQNGVDSLLSNGVLDSPINMEHNVIGVIGIEEHVNCNSLEVSVNNNNNNNNTEESRNNVSCNNCDKNTSNDSDKTVHEKKPPIEKLYSCPKLECNAKFRTKGNLLRHSRSHSGTKPWECSVCLNRFTERKSLKVHMRKHTGERPYRCTVCNKSFAQSGILTSHIAMHMNSKSFGCDQCGRAFRQRSQLKLHLQRHAGIRRFQCSLCEYKFLTKGDLERHQRTHTGERPFNCKLCGKSYTRQQSLKEHINRHFGHKPYSCKHCCKAFAEMSACYKHVKSHKITAELNTDKSVINNDTSLLIEEKNKSAIELAPLIIISNDSKQDELISV